ncbi:MAG: hypothetical protein ACREFE_14785 [Limisphaerales bacterium]
MKIISRSIFALAVVCAFFLAPKQQVFATNASAISAVKGEMFYTKFSLFYEKNVYRTTNYRKGTLVPINTEVTFVKANKKEIDVKLPDGVTLRIVNIEPYSGEDISGIFNRALDKTAVDLSGFSAMEKTNIEAGTVAAGMSKKAVIAALGYPPKHKTPNLTGDAWRYWQNRFNTFIVHFENDKVTGIQQ